LLGREERERGEEEGEGGEKRRMLGPQKGSINSLPFYGAVEFGKKGCWGGGGKGRRGWYCLSTSRCATTYFLDKRKPSGGGP
jgi:hypothetical protein